MKVALINNMNNNFFALMRFLRDNGIDAELFQLDVLDPHFKPECDTFDDLSANSTLHTVGSISFRDFYKIPFSLKLQKQLRLFKKKLESFDLIIACGGLAILEKANIRIDIFIPHGGDLYQSPFMFDYSIKKYFPYSYLMEKYIKYQRLAISKSRAIIALASIDRHMFDALKKLQEKWIDLAIPMVYPLQTSHTKRWDFLSQHDFVLFSHARQGWKTALDYKGNDKAIRAFAQFLNQQNSFYTPIMVLFEYGPDVSASKTLVEKLGIKKHVRWMPTMERKYIYEGLHKASLVFDYFHDEVVSFGGVTFEGFSCSAPVIGNSLLSAVKGINHTLPLIHAFTEDDILKVLLDYSINPDKYIQQGKSARLWFDENVGVGLAKKYINLMEYLVADKTISLKDPRFQLPPLQRYIGPDHIQ
ncbi:MAG: hypothetical protein H0W64_10565 [Gammaproteobacteria bacterium]|nr:hypothetical protein [Gammaproteobacteria bacterium]